jgi:hypothetical protein
MSTPKGGTNANKDVIYIDVDDEITGIIDKVSASDKKIIALVLPKRATVLQSIVNMKLLKRAADGASKNLVLITSEAGLLPLAGNVGIYVSKSLNTKPEIPAAPDRDDDKPDSVEDLPDEDEATLDTAKTVGELSGASSADEADDETIELDDEADGAVSDISAADKKPKKKFSIPNFNKFRLLLILAGVGVLLLGGVGYAALVVMPKATVTIKTNSSSVETNINLTLKTEEGAQLDAEKAIIPAQIQQVQKTQTQEVPATGQVNKGDKAEGDVTMTAKNCTSLSTPKDVPAGTGITASGKTYITQEKANFSGSGTFDGSCLIFQDKNVAIRAQTGGASFNVTSVSFVVAGRSDVTATGTTSGGTDEIVKIVQQADIDAATQKISAQDATPVKQELKTALAGRNLFVIEDTFNPGTPEIKPNVAVGAEAATVTITQTSTFSMLGVKKDDLQAIVKQAVSKDIDTTKQNILSYGIDRATFSLQAASADGVGVAMQTNASTGAELNVASIKQQIAGKKASGAKELITANPGVTDVTVDYSPFWVSSIPKKIDKITVVVQEPEVKTKDATTNP